MIATTSTTNQFDSLIAFAHRDHNRHQVASADGILECVGETPLVRLRRYLDDSSIELHAKLEAANPGGSAKDRPALQMLVHALNTGDVRRGHTVVESSSGNMGIGLAQACRFHGLKFICVVDPHAQPQNLAIMRALGAKVIRIEKPVNGSYLAARLERVQELLRKIPNSYWPNQYANRQNPIAHYEGTIREIDAATGGDLDYLFIATSSTGTAQGCRDYLQHHHRSTKVIAVDANGSVLFGGSPGKRLIPGIGAGHLPALARDQTFDDVVRVSDIDCVVGCRRAASREAMLVGGSAGGVLEVIRSMESELRGKRCVAILHDSGTRYLDTVFNDHWVESALGVTPDVVLAKMSAPALSLHGAA
ncbi:2,3-diaminopropionate biosynthesis protein SbnA [Aporhodopirellula aestuarii]|uniref:N-(2-amino-2-carboxyethyl)-L-glutamate synthase n=1 Tax=Aporhodopirellula aestuarii TaxID=2950107 RepID=A0ABT0TX63_9BACT|nr:2,3-diaminopropionate biosynthesis protein SbnA [Aporhodopirellula aestuarii]MCM2369180.1 2,3-diaminopropionate biosynthesis protein SbnA [Aporhodopirellula aestuarii]